MEQPNVTHDGDARLTPKFWLAVVLTGVATGLFGALLMWILTLVEHAAYNYHSGSYQGAVAAVSGVRRVGSLFVAGAIGAVSWYLIRRYLKNERSEIDEAVWSGDGELSPRRSLLTSVVSEVVIGLGASIGREAAPKLMGGASGSVISHWFDLTPAQKRLLVACGGGAGLAAVYLGVVLARAAHAQGWTAGGWPTQPQPAKQAPAGGGAEGVTVQDANVQAPRRP